MPNAFEYFTADPFVFSQHGLPFYRQYSWFFFFSAVLYLPVITALKWYMKDRKPVSGLRPILVVYNLILTIFNGFVAYYTVKFLIPQFMTEDPDKLICTDHMIFLDDEPVRWMFLFTVSKPFEMLDTVFLILKKRPVILLHWWHHLSVMLFCWHIVYETETGEGGEGMLFALMNSVIHLLMYGYYFITALGIKVNIGMATILTAVQILQMVFGSALEIKKALFCSKEPGTWNPYFGLAMYASYFILFCDYFIRRYITKTRVKDE